MKPFGSQNLPALEFGGINGKLWRDQHRVHAGGRNLRRHLPAVAYVLGEIGAVAVKKHDHDRGAFGVKAWRNVQQHAVVTENLRLPKNIARKLMWPQWPSAPHSRTVGPNRAWCRDTGRAPSRNQRDLSVRRHWMGCARGWPPRAVPRLRAMRAERAASGSASALSLRV